MNRRDHHVSPIAPRSAARRDAALEPAAAARAPSRGSAERRSSVSPPPRRADERHELAQLGGVELGDPRLAGAHDALGEILLLR